MIKINDELLVRLGVGALGPRDRQRLSRLIYETLENRVGRTLADWMTEEQLDEFDMLLKQDDDAGASSWLQQHFPDHPLIVQ